MKVTSYAVARPAYYDRNATSVTNSIAGFSSGPHSTTSRWSTTVPAGKKILIESVFLFMYRVSAPTVNGLTGYFIAVDAPVLATCNIISSLVLAYSTNNLFGNATAYGGSSIAAYSYDLCTGGSVYYDGNFRGTQFDS